MDTGEYILTMLITDEIKMRVSALDAFNLYGISVDKKGFACCPFHAEKTASMKVYGGQRGYYCFGCGKSGDVISFVCEYFDLSFKEATKKLNADFALGLPIGEKIDKRKQLEMKKQAHQKKKEQQRKQEELERLQTALYDAHDYFIRLDRQMQKYKPKTSEEAPHPLFIEALQNIEYAKYAISCAEEQLYLFEQREQK